MPKLPWTNVEAVPPDTEVVVMASRLPLRRYRHIPGFLAATLRIRRQLAGAPGLVGYALDAKLLRKEFWTLSAWTDRRALAAFDRADPHRASVDGIRPHMARSTFTFWSTTAADVPVAWDEATRRVAEADAARDG